MKLAEIKLGLIEQHFSSNCNGISGEALSIIFESLGKSVNLDLSREKLTRRQTTRSSDPSKAFKKFTEGRNAVMSIIDEDDETLNTLFVAIRTGKSVKIANLTTDPITEKVSDLRSVRDALRQAKSFNEDIIFELAIDEQMLSS